MTALAAKPASSKPPLSLSTGRTSGSRGDLRLLLQSKISKHSPSNSSTCPQFFQYVFLTQPEQQLYQAPIMHFSRSLCIRSLETQLEVRGPAHQQLSQCFTGKKNNISTSEKQPDPEVQASSCPVDRAATPAEAAQSTFCRRRYSHPVLQLEEERESARSCRNQLKGTAIISLSFSRWFGFISGAEPAEGRNGESAAEHGHRLPASPPCSGTAQDQGIKGAHKRPCQTPCKTA